MRPDRIVALDSNLIGACGPCCGTGRIRWTGPGAPRPDMVDAMRRAREHAAANTASLRPGIAVPEPTAARHSLCPAFQAQRYGCTMHGVDL